MKANKYKIKYVSTDFVPSYKNSYLTENKLYEFTPCDQDKNKEYPTGGTIKDDTGFELFIYILDSSHLDNRAWTPWESEDRKAPSHVQDTTK